MEFYPLMSMNKKAGSQIRLFYSFLLRDKIPLPSKIVVIEIIYTFAIQKRIFL